MVNFVYPNWAFDHLNIIRSTYIEKLPIYNNNLDYKAWLAGFTDGDGHFHVSLQAFG